MWVSMLPRVWQGWGGIEVTLLDERNYHLFQLLLYQVATAGLSPAEIAAPIRGILSGARNVKVLREKVLDFRLGNRVAISFKSGSDPLAGN